MSDQSTIKAIMVTVCVFYVAHDCFLLRRGISCSFNRLYRCICIHFTLMLFFLDTHATYGFIRLYANAVSNFVYTCSYPFSIVLGRIVGELVTNVTSLSFVTHILWGGGSHSITEVAWCGRFPHLCCQSICLL